MVTNGQQNEGVENAPIHRLSLGASGEIQTLEL
jgi:hypothetical protein